MVVIEAGSEADFGKARAEAINYARNFNPRESCIRKMTPPFVIAAAGKRAEMARASAKGIEMVYKARCVQQGLPAFLEWADLRKEAEAFAGLTAAEAPSPAAAPRGKAALEMEIVKKFLDNLTVRSMARFVGATTNGFESSTPFSWLRAQNKEEALESGPLTADYAVLARLGRQSFAYGLPGIRRTTDTPAIRRGVCNSDAGRTMALYFLSAGLVEPRPPLL